MFNISSKKNEQITNNCNNMNSFLKIHSEQKNLDTEKMPAEPFHVNKSLEKPNTQ